MNRRPAFTLCLAAAMGLATGCSKQPPEGASPTLSPTGVEWQLMSLGGTPAGTGANGHPATLTLDAVAGRASGYAGCNQFSGAYTLTSGGLTFGPLAMTRMACAQGDELERKYSMALDQTTDWKVTSNGLELLRGSTLLARFTK